jgi:hypothetical protein
MLGPAMAAVRVSLFVWLGVLLGCAADHRAPGSTLRTDAAIRSDAARPVSVSASGSTGHEPEDASPGFIIPRTIPDAACVPPDGSPANCTCKDSNSFDLRTYQFTREMIEQSLAALRDADADPLDAGVSSEDGGSLEWICPSIEHALATFLNRYHGTPYCQPQPLPVTDADGHVIACSYVLSVFLYVR